MDADLLAAAGPGRVVIVALAAAPGREYAAASANGVRHFSALGAVADAAPDARSDPAGALAAIEDAQLVVLPGGSPSRLLAALEQTDAAGALRRHVQAGRAVMGASAGAMVLCEHLVLPGRAPRVVPGLALVPGCLVVPHSTGPGTAEDRGWPRPAGVTVLGLPECAGLFVEGGTATAVGSAPSAVGARTLTVGESVMLP